MLCVRTGSQGRLPHVVANLGWVSPKGRFSPMLSGWLSWSGWCLSRAHHGAGISHATGGVRATAPNEVKELNGDVQEETSSGRAGISRATVEPVRVQLV